MRKILLDFTDLVMNRSTGAGVSALRTRLREKSRVGKGISAQAFHRIVLETLTSHGSSHSADKELTAGLN